MRFPCLLATSMMLAALASGCLAGDQAPPEGEAQSPSAAVPSLPLEAGVANATEVWLEGAGVGNAVARRVSFVSAAEQQCEATYETGGNIARPSVVGWVIAFSPSRTWFAHEFIREDVANVAVAGAAPMEPVGEFPRAVGGRSHSTIGLEAGQDMTYVVATSYADRPEEDAGGWFSFRLECPGGLTGLRTEWSTAAHLLSDLSLRGTRASVYAELPVGQTARAEASPDARWSGDLPAGATAFLATDTLAGQAVLTAPSTSFTCGPATDTQAVAGRALCRHDYDGGETSIHVRQTGPGAAAQTGTSDSWMALLAQFESYAWG